MIEGQRPEALIPTIERASDVVRVPVSGRITPMQEICVRMLATGHHNARSIGEQLGISWQTVKKYVRIVAENIPGDLPAQVKVVVWWRGASIEVLTGRDKHGRSLA